jgi:hypothetical protein
LVKRNLLPRSFFAPSAKPVNLVAANNQRVKGGSDEALVELQFSGVVQDTKNAVVVKIPTLLYEADIEEDVILSYVWLAERNLNVVPRKHGVQGFFDGCSVWICGVLAGKGTIVDSIRAIPPVSIQAIHNFRPKALDLFSGTGSVGKVLRDHGYDVISVDVDSKWDPTLCVDISTWDYEKSFSPGEFEIVTACPRCTEFSLALSRRPRRLEPALALVRKTLEIIKFLRPKVWWLETPRTGILARHALLAKFPVLDADHCQFERWGYQKPTRFFGSPHLLSLPNVVCDHSTCPNLVGKDPNHPNKLRAHKAKLGGANGSAKKELTYRIPYRLVEYVCGFTSDGKERVLGGGPCFGLTPTFDFGRGIRR